MLIGNSIVMTSVRGPGATLPVLRAAVRLFGQVLHLPCEALMDNPSEGQLWFKRYPVFNEVIVRVIAVSETHVTFGDDDDVADGNFTDDVLVINTVAEFVADYAPLTK